MRYTVNLISGNLSRHFITFFLIQLCSFLQLWDLINDHPYLFAADPLLLQFFAQAATLDQYKILSTKLPLHLMLIAFVEESPRYSERYVSIYLMIQYECTISADNNNNNCFQAFLIVKLNLLSINVNFTSIRNFQLE